MEENNKLVLKKIGENLIIAILILAYFILINFLYLKFEESLTLRVIKTASLVILFLSIVIFEFAYHKDSGKLTIYGIEILILALHTLIMSHATNKIRITLSTYLVFSSYTFSIYYIFKSILIYTNEKRKYLKSLSDIHEIVSNTPERKEARKRENTKNT